MIKKGIILYLAFLLTACSVSPKPIQVDERYAEAQADLKELFANQKVHHGTLSFSEALARGLKYNLDYRIKLVNSALQAGQLKVATYTMFPAFNTSGSVYKRNNEYASSGITSSGASTDVLNSTPNTIRSARTGLSWNILDFGLGYVRAKQQGERINIAQEEARKQLQQLSQDVLVSYWSAYSAQELTISAKKFQLLLTEARDRLVAAMADPTIPKESILNYQAALLEGNRRIIQLQYKYDKAMIDLKHLLNLPPDEKLTLEPPPIALRKPNDLKNLNFKKLDAITLVNRPELRGQDYQQRIAKLGVKTAILQALPGITLNEGWNYNSNKYLLNQIWVDRSMDVAWNLLNLASLPASYETAQTQVSYEKLKLMALTLSVLTETRFAYSHYETLREEYEIAHKQTLNANALYELSKNRELASLGSHQQVILSELRTLTTKMDEDLLLSDLSNSLGELYLSAGFDLMPLDSNDRPLEEVTKDINKVFTERETWDLNHYIDITYDKMFGSNATDQTNTAANTVNTSNLSKISNKSNTANTNQTINTTELTPKEAHNTLRKPTTASQYTIQVFGSYDLATVKAAKAKFKLPNSVNYGMTKNKGKDWYVLTYGSFNSVQDAKSSINKLPKPIKTLAPWTRKTDDLTWVT